MFLGNVKSYIDKYYKTNNTFYLVVLYELFCNTFIKSKQIKSDLQYDIFGNKISYCIHLKIKDYTNEILEKVKNSEKTSTYRIVEEEKTIIALVKIPVVKFMNKYKKMYGYEMIEYLKEQYRMSEEFVLKKTKIDKYF